ncbi:hypothetical protein C8T65DRAFT_736306 [Cerioporus squamosus]|nr:hypothetical protein C8T65DRAFT_736306 [Cerioporus squamosus]
MSTTTSSASGTFASTPSAPTPSGTPSSTTRRPREPEDDVSAPDDGDTAETPRRKRARKSKKENSYSATGAAVGLMGDLFRDFQAILDFGLQFVADTPQATMSSRDRKYLALYRYILSLAPEIVDDIAKRGPKGTFTVARELESGRSGVRGVDIHN